MSESEVRVEAAMAAREIASSFSVLADVLESGKPVSVDMRLQFSTAVGEFLGALTELIKD
jgi:hypothetical protein